MHSGRSHANLGCVRRHSLERRRPSQSPRAALTARKKRGQHPQQTGASIGPRETLPALGPQGHESSRSPLATRTAYLRRMHGSAAPPTSTRFGSTLRAAIGSPQISPAQTARRLGSGRESWRPRHHRQRVHSGRTIPRRRRNAARRKGAARPPRLARRS